MPNFKKVGEHTRDDILTIWINWGKEKEGYTTIMPREEVQGYIEKLFYSEKHSATIASILSSDKQPIRYMFFCPPGLEWKLSYVLERYGKCLVKIVYLGLQTTEREGKTINFHGFDVYYDETETLKPAPSENQG
ncbi:MAG: hypothetical protein ABDH18_02840 [Aquificaceae bacterium]